MDIQHFMRYVNKTETCWLWTGPLSRDGYGRYKNQMAHRIMYQLHKGPYPPGTVTDHLCRTRNCINPNHLEAVTQKENVKRGQTAQAAKQRHAKTTHCPAGHPYTPDNTYNHYQDGYTHRKCKTCTQQRTQEQHARNRLTKTDCKWNCQRHNQT